MFRKIAAVQLLLLSIGCNGYHDFRIDVLTDHSRSTSENMDQVKSILDDLSSEHGLEKAGGHCDESYLSYGEMGFGAQVECRIWVHDQIISFRSTLFGQPVETDDYKAIKAGLLNSVREKFTNARIIILDKGNKKNYYNHEIRVALPDQSYIDYQKFSNDNEELILKAIDALDAIAENHQLIKLRGYLREDENKYVYYYVGGEPIGLQGLEKSIMISTLPYLDRLIIDIYDFKDEEGIATEQISKDIFTDMVEVFGLKYVDGE